jgi:predicted RNase H-like nuclease (RuvC/YqgF family)
MNTTLLTKESTTHTGLQLVKERLDEMNRHVEEEVLTRQALIDRQYDEINQLRRKLADNEHSIHVLRSALEQCKMEGEGRQQLVNKLLNDITQYINDIDWYKRTYEKRTFLGVIKEKLFRK